MIDRSKWLLAVCCAIFANLEQPVRQAGAAFATDSLQALANCFGRVFPGNRGQLLREFARFFILSSMLPEVV